MPLSGLRDISVIETPPEGRRAIRTPVGELEITEVTDASVSHARVISLNPGVKAEFSDIVRPEP